MNVGQLQLSSGNSAPNYIYVPPLPVSIPELKVRIRTAIENITVDMPQTVWDELDYRVDVCRITKGAHIEHL
jgi:N-glycosylase/DNA lyase